MSFAVGCAPLPPVVYCLFDRTGLTCSGSLRQDGKRSMLELGGGVWLLLVGSFLVGSIPFCWLVARAIGIDLLRQGSGNPGATNLFRLAGKQFGALGLCLDVSKGAVPVLVCMALEPGEGSTLVWILVGLCSVLGHCFSPFLRGRGGKGVATTGGVLLVLEPWIAVTMLVSWGLARIISDSVGIASVVAAATGVLISLTLLVFSDQVAGWSMIANSTTATVLGWVLLALSCLVIVRHHSNIREYCQARREESPR